MGYYRAVPFEMKDFNAITGDEGGVAKVDTPLEEIANLCKNGEEGFCATDAIASPVAHIKRFRNQFSDRNDSSKSYYKEQWKAALTVIALSRYLALDKKCVSIESNDIGENIRECIYNELTDNVENQLIDIIVIDGMAVGMADDEFFIIPARNFPEQIMQIYKDMKNNSVESAIVHQYLTALGNKADAGNMAAIRQNIDEFIEEINAGTENRNYTYPEQRETSGSEIKKALFTVPKLPVDLPKVFTDKLFIIDPQFNRENNTSNIETALTVRLEEEEYEILIPFSKEMVEKILEVNNDNVQYKDFEFNCEYRYDENNEGKKFFVSAKFNVISDGRTYPAEYKKSFSSNDVEYFINKPDYGVYPYVNLTADEWKQYNIISIDSDSQAYMNMDNMPRVLKEIFNRSRERFDGRKVYVYDEMAEKTDIECKWTIGFEINKASLYTCRSIPRFVKVYSRNENDDVSEGEFCGSIYLGKPFDRYERTFSEANIAIDFGTSTTVIGIRQKGVNDDPLTVLHNKDLVKNSSKVAESFISKYVVPTTDVEGKIHTIVQLYNGFNDVTNRMFYKSGAILNNNFDIIKQIVGIKGSLKSYNIFQNLKFNNMDDELNALYVFMKNIVWWVCLQCKLSGVKRAYFILSYPKRDVLNMIKDAWRVLERDIAEYTDIQVQGDLKSATEAMACAKYLDKRFEDNLASRPDGEYIICDIGDGTTDISVNKKNNEFDSVSLKYAGNDIITNTISGYFKNDRTDYFKTLWNNKEGCYTEVINAYVKTFEEIENTYERKEKQRLIILELIDKTGFDNTMYSTAEKYIFEKFRSIIALRFCFLFKLISEFVGQKIDKRSGNESAIKIYLYGGGRFALSEILNEDLNDIKCREYISLFKNINGLGARQVILSSDDNRKKEELAKGLLEIADTINVGEADEALGADIADTTEKDIAEIDTGNTATFKEMYNEFISQVKKVNEDVSNNLFNYRDSRSNIHCIIDSIKLEKNEDKFNSSYTGIWNKVKEEQELPQKLYKAMFCVRMADYLLEESI